MQKKKIIVKGILITLVLVIGLVLYSEKVKKIEIIENIKSTINNKVSLLSEQIQNNTSSQKEAKERTIIDVTNLEMGEETEHEHIYKTMYDNEKHWEECTVCSARKNEVNHTFTTTWARGEESCGNSNSYTKTCTCGYSYKGLKPCVWDGKSYIIYSDVRCHARKCSICKGEILNTYYLNSYGNGTIYDAKSYENYLELMNREKCHTSDGINITCQDINKTCSICKQQYTTKVHRPGDTAQNNILVCRICGKDFGTYTEPKVTINSTVPATCTIECDFKLTNGAIFSKTGSFYDPSVFFSTNTQQVKNLSQDKTEFTIVNTVKFNSNVKSIYNNCLTLYISIDGTQTPVSIKAINLYPDGIKPTISNIDIQETRSAEWSKTKTIVISGTENWTNTVKVEILDDENKIIFEGNANVSNKNYSISYTPEIEANEIGRKFKVRVTDACENSTEQEFTISKVDIVAPNATSAESITGEWAKERNFTFTAKDEGIGNVSIGFNNVNDYKLATKTDDNYSRDYKFVGDVYKPINARVFYKDELGNVSIQVVTIDKIDNTAPTITNASLNGNKLIIVANDEHETLGEGSGIVRYKYITSSKKIENPSVTESWKEADKNSEIIIEKVNEVKYIYIVAEDAAGNVSNVYTVETANLVLNTQVNLEAANGKGGVDLDWSDYDGTNKIFKAYQKKEGAEEFEIISAVDGITEKSFTDNSSQDLKAPNSPTINAEKENNQVKVNFNSNDNGSTYLFYVEAYDSSDSSIKLATSNQRTETVTTGTKGYYYIINENSENTNFDITIDGVQYTEDANVFLDMTNNRKYVHVKAVDKAGNISEASVQKIDVIDLEEKIIVELTQKWVDNNVQALRRPDKIKYIVMPYEESLEKGTVVSEEVMSEDDTLQKDATNQEEKEIDTISQSQEENKTKQLNENQSKSDTEKSETEKEKADSKTEIEKSEVILNIKESDNTLNDNILNNNTVNNIALNETKKLSKANLVNELVSPKNVVLENKALETNENEEIKSEDITEVDKEISTDKGQEINNNNKQEEITEKNELNTSDNTTNTEVSEEIKDEIIEPKENSSIKSDLTEGLNEENNIDNSEDMNPLAGEQVEYYTMEFIEDVDKTKASEVYTLELPRYNQETFEEMQYIIKQEEINEGDLEFYETTGGLIVKGTDEAQKYKSEIVSTFGLPVNNKKDITAIKNWVDNDNKKLTRPSSIVLELIGRVKDIEVLTQEEQGTTNTIEINNGTTANEEGEINNKTTNVENINTAEVNTETTTEQPEEITYKDIVTKEGNISQINGWRYVFSQLPIYDENGQEIEYEIREKAGQEVLNKYISETSKINEANEIEITNSSIIRNSNIQETGSEEINSVDDNLLYNVNYTAELDNRYTENATIEIVDTLPYQIDLEKSDLKDGIYNYNEENNIATITWRGTYNAVEKTVTLENNTEDSITVQVIDDVERKLQVINIQMEIGIIYKDIQISTEKIVNNVSGKITLSNGAVDIVEANCETKTRWVKDVVVNKMWKGDTIETRPDSITVELSTNNTSEKSNENNNAENSNISENISESNNDANTELLQTTNTEDTIQRAVEIMPTTKEDGTVEWAYTWAELPTYDTEGNEIKYTVDETGINYTKNEQTVENEYYCEKTEESENGKTIITLTNIKYGSIKVTKVDSRNQEIKLQGAEFKLEKMIQNGEEWIVPEETSENYIAYIGTTGEDGTYTFEGLKYGQYKLTEVKAPEDYKIGEKDLEDIEINEENADVEKTVENIRMYKLPITGGIGVDTIRNLEILLVIIAIIILTNRKKVRPERRSRLEERKLKRLQKLGKRCRR